MIKYLLILFPLIFLSVVTFSQGLPLPPTKSFTISGDIKSPKTINDIDLKNYTSRSIEPFKVTNHKGEVKRVSDTLSGVLLKDILQVFELNTDNPKVYNEYYIVCKASDGYQVVFSWNEIFNTAIGQAVYVITAKAGEPMTEDSENILLVSTHDINTGRRYLKNLQSIFVGRVK